MDMRHPPSARVRKDRHATDDLVVCVNDTFVRTLRVIPLAQLDDVASVMRHVQHIARQDPASFRVWTARYADAADDAETMFEWRRNAVAHPCACHMCGNMLRLQPCVCCGVVTFCSSQCASIAQDAAHTETSCETLRDLRRTLLRVACAHDLDARLVRLDRLERLHRRVRLDRRPGHPGSLDLSPVWLMCRMPPLFDGMSDDMWSSTRLPVGTDASTVDACDGPLGPVLWLPAAVTLPFLDHVNVLRMFVSPDAERPDRGMDRTLSAIQGNAFDDTAHHIMTWLRRRRRDGFVSVMVALQDGSGQVVCMTLDESVLEKRLRSRWPGKYEELRARVRSFC